MGNYTSIGYYRHEISKEQYNYLLPIYGYSAKVEGAALKTDAFMVERDSKYLFIGSDIDFKDMQNRCKYM